MAADGFLFSHNTHDGSPFFVRAHTPKFTEKKIHCIWRKYPSSRYCIIYVVYDQYNDFMTYLMCYIDANLFI